MFAPPMRPNSAASQRPRQEPLQQQYQPHPYQNGMSHGRSLSWDAQQGLPPPPSQIDHYDLSNALLASHGNPHPHPQQQNHPHSHHHLQYQDTEESSERDTRQLPMNSVSKHPKLKLDVVLTSNTFEAGGKIDGRLEITSATSQRLRLGEIAVELEGIEELTSRDHSATQLFLYNRTLFQGPQLPPSNAVLPAAPVNGYWTARKGRTTFPFSFKIPPSAPSTVQFGGNASLRYSLKATCQTWWSEQKTMVTSRKEAFVVEKWQDEFDEKYNQPIEVVGDTRLFMGGNGQIWLEAGISNNLFFSGGQMLIRCGIKNNTKRLVSGMKVSLARRLIFPVSQAGNGIPAARQSLEPIITEIVTNQNFKGSPQYDFGPNEEIVTNLNVEIPKDLRTIRKTRLFEIQIVALISLHLGNFAKDLTVELPISVANTLSTMTPPDGNLESLHPNHPNHPHRHLQHQQHHHQGQILQRAASAAGHRSPGDFNNNGGQMMGGAMAQFEQYGLDRGWSPAPQQHHQQLPFQHPSGEQFNNMPMPQRPTSAMAMGNSAPAGWTPSTFLASLPTASQLGVGVGINGYSDQQNHQQQTQNNLGMGLPPIQRPGSAMGINSQELMTAGMNRSASAAPNLMQQQQHQHFNQASPQAFNHGGFSSPVPPQRSFSASPGPQSQGFGFGYSDQQQQQQQQRSRLAHMPEPQHIPQPQPQIQQRSQSQPQFQSSPIQIQSSITPPSPIQTQQSPSLSQSQSQSPSQSQPENQSYSSPISFPQAPPIPLGLSTIEEDSESQAGTMRSMRGLLAANGASVTRQDVVAFEKMVGGGSEDETPLEKKERERELMKSMGMRPDDEEDEEEEREREKERERKRKLEEKRRNEERIRKEEEEYQKSLPKPPVPSMKNSKSSELEKTEILANSRPRASDIFNKSNSVDVPKETTSTLPISNLNNLKSSMSKSNEKKSNQNHSVQFPDSNQQTTTTNNRSVSLGNVEKSKSNLNNVLPTSTSNPTDIKSNVRVRNDSLTSGGIGLGALETRLSSPAPLESPSLERAESTRTLTMANVKPSSRSRHDSAPTSSSGTSALKKAATAAAEREIKAKKEAEEMLFRREKEARESERKRKIERESQVEKVDSVTPTLAADRIVTVSRNSATSDGERKKVDFNEQRQLNKQAVGRVAGWLSSGGSGGIETKESAVKSSESLEKPSSTYDQFSKIDFDFINSPKTPSPSVMIPADSEKEEKEDDRSIDAIIRRSSYNSGRHKESQDEIPPTLSADLRALIDSTDGSQAKRKLSNGLKDHPISRKLSGSGDPNISDYKRERHTSLPSGPSNLNLNPRGGYPGLIRSPSKAIPTASTFERVSSGKSFEEEKPKVEIEEEIDDPNEEIKVPSRVIKALSSTNTASSAASNGGGAIKARSTRSSAATTFNDSKPSGSEGGLLVSDPTSVAKYDAKSARGGKGGRVASVASLWANIADGDSNSTSNSGPKTVVSVKPKPRSSNNSKISGEGGAPALDFSQKKLKAVEEKKKEVYKTPALKSVSAPQFINTTMPKPVFSNKEEINQVEEIEEKLTPEVKKEEIKPSTKGSSLPTNGSTIPAAVRNFSVPSNSSTAAASSSSSISSTSTVKPISRYVSQPSIPISISKTSMKLPTPKSSNSIRSLSPSRSPSKNNLSSSNSSNTSISNSGSIHEFSAANFRSQSKNSNLNDKNTDFNSSSVSNRRQTVDFLSKPLNEAEKYKLREEEGLDVDKVSIAAGGRGTTKPIGKNKLNELRGLFGA